MGVKTVKRPRLRFTERIYLGTVVKGLRATIRHFFGVLIDRMFRWNNKKFAITMEYPEERWDFKDNFRGAPALVVDEQHRGKCVACQICEFVCPPKAITIWPAEFEEAASDLEKKIEKYPARFEIDMLRCIYCGYCEEACPEEAIFLVKEAELVYARKQDFVHDKEKLYEMGGVRADRIRKWQNK
ncbi:MAG: 4Fe-4S binding protein [Planctomycetota bacterium]